MVSNAFPNLLSPGRIGTLEIRNRIATTAMGVSMAEEDGTAGERLIAYHEEQAKGGVGLIILGATGVAWPVGCVQWQQAAISEDRFIPGLSKLADRVHAHGAKIAAQLHMGGLVAGYSFAKWGHPLWTPSMPPPPKGNFAQYFMPDELAGMAGVGMPELKIVEQADLDLLVQQFAQGARRAREAGLDGVEIHGAHGYILSNFLSPAGNTRTDRYGGSRENRARLLREVIEAVRAEVGPDYPMWVKLDLREEGREGGLTIEDAIYNAQAAQAAGADAITCSASHETGDAKLHTQSHTPHQPGLNLPGVAQVKKAVSIPVIGSGRVEPEVGDRAIGNGEADFISMGRKLLADPHLPRKLAEGRRDEVRSCIYCYTCISAIYLGADTRCAIRPETGREFEQWPQPNDSSRHVVVIGGGPGGMESTRRLGELGHKVTLLEARERLGGTLRFAALAYEPNERLLNWLTREVEESGADLRLGTMATPELLASLKPDAVIVATGAVRGMPDIPGNHHDHVLSGDDLRGMMFGETSDAIKRKTSLFTRVATKVGAATGATANLDLVRKATRAWMPLGDKVVIIGGELVGLELAEFLSERGRTVTVVDDQPNFGKGLSVLRRMRLIPELAEHGVRLEPGAQGIAIGKDAVTWIDAGGAAQSAACDTVIVAKGAQGDSSVADVLRAAGHEVHLIGDAGGVGYIEGAMWGAARAVNAIAGNENSTQLRMMEQA
jgi:2,4-dienoyl-CoA reductase-like NADH-dependent reductase (Old Yellow Enzyme family)/NADPH-dependent 2,4-dienoyl-CoA reductase/sulfur reductase-like enzyme